jgi:CelD/BcsL family acetyltransferase involved in cellulose biosynthesis
VLAPVDAWPVAARGGHAQYDIAVTEGEPGELMCQAWTGLLAASASEEKLYQTPAFFRYLRESAGAHEPFALFTVTRRSDAAIVGVVPVRLIRQNIDFRAGPLGCATFSRPLVQILGSVPMLPERGLFPELMERVLEHFPQACGVSMQAMPRTVFEGLGALPGWRVRVLDGWRECHTIALPGSFDAYLQRFSSKKRYNLSRQVRLLAAQAGDIALLRIAQPGEVGSLFTALRTLAAPAELTTPQRQQKFERLAANGLLHSYVLRCGEHVIGAIVATRAEGKWHVHNIFGAQAWHHLSPGSTAVHLALKDLLEHDRFAEADFGYGTPNHDFRSTHVLKTRGHVLLYRPRTPLALALAVHRWYARIHDRAASIVKQCLRRMPRRRR